MAARSIGIQAYGRDEFVANLADFKPYLDQSIAEYERSEIGALFVPLKIREEIKGETKGKPVPLDAFMDSWLNAPDSTQVNSMSVCECWSILVPGPDLSRNTRVSLAAGSTTGRMCTDGAIHFQRPNR